MKIAEAEIMKGVIGVITKIYIGVIQNLVNFSSKLCFLVVNRIILNILGLHIEKIMEDHSEKVTKIQNKVSRIFHICCTIVTLNNFMG